MKKGDRVVNRERGGFYDGETLTVVSRGKDTVRVRTSDGYQADVKHGQVCRSR